MKSLIHPVIVYGVSGCGKSTIASEVSRNIDAEFLDADDFHPQANLDKMASGDPLNDEDRQPWLEHLNTIMVDKAKAGIQVVLACSALKETYRRTLSKNITPFWCHLALSEQMVIERMMKRQNHFMKANMVSSQFEALEKPDYGLIVDATHSVENIVKIILEHIRD
ncbi:MAG: gluconokinase [Saccharospirillaceae bacterium]|nr:gluconokinase [Pseudomonadales bacterium]NRB80657.1 gluconokinase [Saccharospirillaceae bacterium]